MGFGTYFDEGIVVLMWRKSLKVAFVGYVDHRLYVVDFSGESTTTTMCLMAKGDVGWLWHRRLAHVNMRTLQSLYTGGHILGINDACFARDRVCRTCMEGKMSECKHTAKNIISSKRIFELLHVDLFGPTPVDSLGGKK